MTAEEKAELVRLKGKADAAWQEWNRTMRTHCEARAEYDKAQAAYIKFKQKAEAQ